MQVICGVMAVIMPGSTLGNGAVLGAIAAADIGQTLADRMLFMGAPAAATTKHDAGGPHPSCHAKAVCIPAWAASGCNAHRSHGPQSMAMSRNRKCFSIPLLLLPRWAHCVSSPAACAMSATSTNCAGACFGRCTLQAVFGITSCAVCTYRRSHQATGHLPVLPVLDHAGGAAPADSGAGSPGSLHHCLCRSGSPPLPALRCPLAGRSSADDA